MEKKKLENADEAREKFFLDEDRMINEGLAGGTVSGKENSGVIEEARDLEAEEPPHKVE